jgi:PAS domain S-box-containing protein
MAKRPPPKFDVAHSYAVRLMQHLVVPTFVIDPKRRVVIWNRACERLTGVSASEVVGTTKHWQAFYETKRYCLADLVALDLPEQLPELYSEYAARGHNGLGFSAENWCVMPRLGSQLYLAIDAGQIHNDAGNLIAVVETLRDLTDQKRAEMALKELATKDGLTGLSNRRSFDQMLMAEWSRAQRTRQPLSLLFVDSTISSCSTICTATRPATNACARSQAWSASTPRARSTSRPVMAARNSR